MKRAVAFLVAGLAGCGDDSALSDGPEADAAPLLTVGATHGSLDNAFSANIAGSGSGVDVALDGDVGTMMLDGEAASAAIYNSVPFGDYQIYGTVVVAADRWWIAYPYCEGDALVDVYAEIVGPGGFVLSPASGTCASTSTSTPQPVDLPAFSFPQPSPVGDATVSGPQIQLDHGSGQLEIDGAMQPATVFSTVDCSTDCGTPGWYELHTVAWDAATHAATFVIVYLEIGSPTTVQLSYALRLPTLDDPLPDAILSATWTGTSARSASGAPPHLPPPWQRTARIRP